MNKYLFCLFFLCLLLLACRDQSVIEDLTVFHYNQHNNITSLDPAFAKSQNNVWAVHHIFSTLVQLDEQLNIRPAAARAWDISEDGLTYTFYLNMDIAFHPDECFGPEKSRTIRASDIVFSYSRLLDSNINAPGSWIFAGKIRDESPFVAVSDSVFQLNLQQPFSPMLSLLTMQYTSIVPQEASTFYGKDFYRHPVGSGPFQFVKWIDNEGLFLKRFDGYYEWMKGEASSNVDVVRTSFIGDRNIALLELMNDRIDLFSGLESSYINTALDAEGKLRQGFERFQFIKAPFLNFEYMGMNPEAPGAHPLLAEKGFRQALNYAIDRPVMLATLRNQIGKPADAGAITRGLPSYDPTIVKGYDYDVQKALELMSGFNEELRREELTIHTSKDYLDLTTYIAKQWEDLGLNIRIEVMESAALRDAMRRGEIPVFRASWIADYPDGESFLSMFYSNNPAPPNYTQFSNPDFDELYDEAMGITDLTEKIKLYQAMDKIVVGEAPVIFLFYDEVALFASNRLEGISKNALNLLQVKNLQKRQ